jgi:GT2 family glycosyltransferase
MDFQKSVTIGVVIVNYRTDERTISFVNNEISKISTPHITVVVNNEATDKSDTLLCQSLNAEKITDISNIKNYRNKCYVLSHPENLGYAKGNNLGASFINKHFDVSYFLFSNNDIVLTDKNVVEVLVDRISTMADVAIIGPNIIGLKGERQSPYPYHTFWNRYFWVFWLTPFMPKRIKESLFKLNYSSTAKEGVHYRIMGSFFIVRQKDFTACGMMDPNTFLFAEEAILSERIHNINKKVYFYPEVAVLHEHGKTITQFYNKKKRCKIGFENESYYYRKYRHVSPLSIFIGRCSYWCYIELKDFFKSKELLD